MSAHPYKVGIVVDPEFGVRMFDLARSIYLWVIASSTNAPLVQAFWDSLRAGPPMQPHEDPIANGITPFEPDQTLTLEELCADVAIDVEDHHGEFAHDPPWTELEVYGMSLTPLLREVFEELGVNEFLPTAEGFLCRRASGHLIQRPA